MTFFYALYKPKITGTSETARSIASQTKRCKKISSVGYVIQNDEIKIVDEETGKALGFNQVGEICVKSESIMTGYYENLQETKNCLDIDGILIEFENIYNYDAWLKITDDKSFNF